MRRDVRRLNSSCHSELHLRGIEPDALFVAPKLLRNVANSSNISNFPQSQIAIRTWKSHDILCINSYHALISNLVLLAAF
jgi:hypothetical protein